MKKWIASGVVVAIAILGWWVVPWLYRAADASYQRATDPIRIAHAREIAAVVLEYADKTGHFPFADLAAEKPFMILIGHSPEEEDAFGNDPVLRRGGRFANASMLEAELSKVLGRPVLLRRDPQRVATYAPNVYVYFVTTDQMAVAVHLFGPAEHAVAYDWRGGRFYSYAQAYAARARP